MFSILFRSNLSSFIHLFGYDLIDIFKIFINFLICDFSINSAFLMTCFNTSGSVTFLSLLFTHFIYQ